MRKLFLSFFIFLTFNTTFAEKHPLHIALVSIEYNSEMKNFDVLVKIFIDDFEAIIARKYGVELNSGENNENPNSQNFDLDKISPM